METIFTRAEGYFRKALERLTQKNPNPYDSEAYYHLGLVLFYQRRYEEALEFVHRKNQCFSIIPATA